MSEAVKWFAAHFSLKTQFKYTVEVFKYTVTQFKYQVLKHGKTFSFRHARYFFLEHQTCGY